MYKEQSVHCIIYDLKLSIFHELILDYILENVFVDNIP
mgnify:FL=1